MLFEPFGRSKDPNFSYLLLSTTASAAVGMGAKETGTAGEKLLGEFDLATVGDGLLKEEGILGIGI